MFGNPAVERAAIESTYEDTLDLTRVEKTTGANHITKTAPKVIVTDCICALSYSGGNNSRQTEAQHDVDHDAVVFAPLWLDVRPGDGIILTRFGRFHPDGRKLNFEVIGRPNLYATHQEIKVKEGGLA